MLNDCEFLLTKWIKNGNSALKNFSCPYKITVNKISLTFLYGNLFRPSSSEKKTLGYTLK